MNLKRRATKLRAGLMISFAIALSGCITVVPDSKDCTASGALNWGMMCGHTNTNRPFNLTLKETIDLLEPQFARKCVPAHPGLNVCKENPSPSETPIDLPARGGAIVTPAADYNGRKTALEILCRKEGKNCEFETVQEENGANKK